MYLLYRYFNDMMIRRTRPSLLVNALSNWMALAVTVLVGLLLTPYNPVFEQALAVYERGSKKYRNALRELAGNHEEES